MNDPDHEISTTPSRRVPVPPSITTWLPEALAVDDTDTGAPVGSWHFVAQDAVVQPPSAVGFSIRTFASCARYSPSPSVHTREPPASPAAPALRKLHPPANAPPPASALSPHRS